LKNSAAYLKISGPQQGWPRPLPGAILIPPALLVVADLIDAVSNKRYVKIDKKTKSAYQVLIPRAQ